MTAAAKQPKKPAAKKPPLKGPAAGAGRPRNATAPRSETQAELADRIDAAEEAHEQAIIARRTDDNIHAQMRELACEYAISSAWAAYLRAQGNHTWAMQYIALAVKQDSRVTAIRELLIGDRLDEVEDALADEQDEDGLGKRGPK